MKLGGFGVLAATRLLQASSLSMQPRPHYCITNGMGGCSQTSESSCQCDGVSSREGGIPGIMRLTAHNNDLKEPGLSERRNWFFQDIPPLQTDKSTMSRVHFQLDWRRTKDLKLAVQRRSDLGSILPVLSIRTSEKLNHSMEAFKQKNDPPQWCTVLSRFGLPGAVRTLASKVTQMWFENWPHCLLSAQFWKVT